jgi:predicted metal-dependent enzyme (double-stranded beta helix superfamily)
VFVFYDDEKNNGILVEFARGSVIVNQFPEGNQLQDPNNVSGLIPNKGVSYWFSLDSQNQRLYAGVGEARLETSIYSYSFPKGDPEAWEKNKKCLESLTTLYIAKESVALQPRKLLRDPVTQKIPMLVKEMHSLTMNHIAQNTYLPHSMLNDAGKHMFGCIAGKKFHLNTKEFPDFTKSIERSIVTPGLWCYETLQKKKKEFNPDSPNIEETYLRITLSQNNGESPGIPYVMEIWPIGHYSPVHNHAEANAIIRVLHGKISVNLYAYLCEEKEGIFPFRTDELKKEDITWITPGLNQTHMLTNPKTNKETCITLQCYMYGERNAIHYDYFDYIDDTGSKQQYEPDSDMDFLTFKELMKEEWDARPKKKWWKCF